MDKNFKLSETVVEQAYLYLKNYAYNENVNFFLKKEIAKFECGSFQEDIGKLSRLLRRRKFSESPSFRRWLNSIEYYVLPKKVGNPEGKNGVRKENGRYISNVTTRSEYRVEELSYFIAAPVELRIIEVLWCLIVGPLMEKNLRECCYSSRLRDSAKRFVQQENTTQNFRPLFKFYVNQYGSWRDRALKVATEISKNGQDVALLSLDFKSYFYNIDLNFGKIMKQIEEDEDFKGNGQLLGIARGLTDCLRKIFSAYHEKTKSSLRFTHSGCSEGKIFLPVGLPSSAILANWYLAEFDREIQETVRPDYYGRYVDDIIMVFKNPGMGDEISIGSFVDKFLGGQLIDEQLFKSREIRPDPHFYVQVDDNRLPIRQDKLILHFLDKEHSRAVLEVFRQQLQERSSAFRFLPGEEVEKELDRFAYDILYEGSHNKLRSIQGVAENEIELSTYLAKHITLHRLCKTDRKDSLLSQLERFFKGRNAIRFSRLWEKVYQYAVIVNDFEFIGKFYKYLNSEIDKTEVLTDSEESCEHLTKDLQEHLKLYNKISLGLCVALLKINLLESEGEENGSGEKGKKAFFSLVRNEKIVPLARWLRAANLVRHRLVAWPLANFTAFEGDLTDEQEFRNSGMNLEDEKMRLSPRFIHFDELQLFDLQKVLAEGEKGSLLKWQEMFQGEKYKRYFPSIPVKSPEDQGASEEGSGKVQKTIFSVGGKTKASLGLRIALANIKIEKSDIEKAIRKDEKPNISFERQKGFTEVLNCAVREKADMLIMPELSTPVSWLPFMAAHSRRHQLAMIFGLEHWEAGGFVHNLLVELLPFKFSEKYNSCFMTARLKNHYAPDELKLIETLRLEPASDLADGENYYNRISWNGVTFASYNCFELSDIEHRKLFKSEIDILFACVFNKDTNYYGHILESAARDLHCYVVQSNASQYGGSCVLRPTRTEDKTMLHVKGGVNPSVLVAEVDVAALRSFQYNPSPESENYFKPLPPGFDSEKVLER